MLGHPTGHLWWVHLCQRTLGGILAEFGEAIPVMGAFCGPLGRVRAEDACSGNIIRVSGPVDGSLSNVHTTYPL